MSMYNNDRSDDSPKKPIEVLNDRLDGLINQFINFNLAIAALTKRVDALERGDDCGVELNSPTKARKRVTTTTTQEIN